MSKSLRRIRKRIKNWIIFVILKHGIIWVNKVDRKTGIKFLQNFACLGFYLARSERHKTIKHLTMAYGSQKSSKEIYRMAREVFLNLGRNMADTFRLQQINSENIDKYVKAEGLENLEKALRKGKGVIAITGHIGNWELLGSYLAMKGFVTNVVGAPVYDPRLDDLVVKNRIHAGMKYISREPVTSATKEVLGALRRNEVIGLLIDHDTNHVANVFIDFFGRKANTPVGPAVLAMKTGAAVVPMVIHSLEDGTHLVQVEKELVLNFSGDGDKDRIYNTQLCSDAIERFIRRYPTHWVWMHERWKRQPKLQEK